MVNHHATLPNELIQQSNQVSESIDTSRPGQITTGLGNLTVTGSLAYYLGTNSQYFTNGATTSEVPLFAAFTAMSFLAVNELVNICGRKSTKTLVSGLLQGGNGGLGLGLTIAGMALGTVGDLITCGGFTLTGLLAGWLLTRRGKKKHICGERLPCDKWICTRCKRIIAPSKEWVTKDNWNILDVCDYLDKGGLEWNTIKSLAFLEHAGLLKAAKKYEGSPLLWNPGDIKKKTSDESVMNKFVQDWKGFLDKENLSTESLKEKSIEEVFDRWRKFHLTPNNGSGKT